MRIERFEDIEAWREGRKLVDMIYDISESDGFSQDYSVKNQIRSAAVSVMSNISEGFDRGTNREFIQFLAIARTSATEVKSQLYVASDRRYIERGQFESIYNQATSVRNLINGFIRYLKNVQRK